MRPTRREIVCLVASFVFWSVVALHLNTPHGTLLNYEDQFSHVGMARAFIQHGFDIYRLPEAAFCKNPPTPEAVAWGERAGCPPGDLCDIEDDRGAPAACVGWQEYPHPYPPGAMISMVPEALVARFTRLSPRVLSGVVVLKYLVTTHIFLWALYRVVFARQRDPRRGPVAWTWANPWLRWTVFGLLSLETLKWTLTGFYDPLAILPILLGIHFLRERSYASAFAAMSCALFMHFRALWYLPLLGYAALGILRRREWQRPGWTATKVLAGLAMSGASLYVFYLLRHAVTGFPLTNPVLYSRFDAQKGAYWDMAVPCALILAYLLSARHWLLFATVAWQLFVVAATPQTMNWHAMFLLPLFGVATIQRGSGPAIAATAIVAIETVVIFVAFPLPGGGIAGVISLWGGWLGH
jgi:hypothetical protein